MSDIIHLTLEKESVMANYLIDIRKRRQATFPAELLRQLGVGVGDALEAKVKGKEAILKPKKQIALEALKEIQKIFNKSKITEKELEETARQQRITSA